MYAIFVFRVKDHILAAAFLLNIISILNVRNSFVDSQTIGEKVASYLSAGGVSLARTPVSATTQTG